MPERGEDLVLGHEEVLEVEVIQSDKDLNLRLSLHLQLSEQIQSVVRGWVVLNGEVEQAAGQYVRDQLLVVVYLLIHVCAELGDLVADHVREHLQIVVLFERLLQEFVDEVLIQYGQATGVNLLLVGCDEALEYADQVILNHRSV